MPSWPGARSAWPSARGERTVNVGPPGAVAGVVAPSHHRIVNGRSGNASSRRSRSTSGRASAIALLGALRREAVGVDAHDVPGEPGALEQPDDPGRDVELPAAEAGAAGRGAGGTAWRRLCRASPTASGASHARSRASSPVVNVRRPKKWQSELM